MKRPINTLFLLQSLDGKINPWSNNSLSQWREFGKIKGLREWVMQYYKLEQETDLYSLNSWKVMKKIWMNDENYNFEIYSEVSFIIIDSKHLNKIAVEKMASKLKKLFIITTNKNHIAFSLQKKYKNLEILYYEEKIDFKNMMEKLYKKYNIENITIQSWWSLNSVFFENNLIDKISVVIAPVVIWWKDTPTLVDGKSIEKMEDLNKLKVLKLRKINQLENGYIHLEYDVEEKTEIVEGIDVPN